MNFRSQVIHVSVRALPRLRALAACLALLLAAAADGQQQKIQIIFNGQQVIPDGWESIVPNVDELANVAVDPQVETLVAELDAPTFEERERATWTLHSHPCDKHQLYAVLAREGLSLEQRSRLMFVLRERVLNRPRGAIGVSFANVASGIRIQAVIPGMPSDGVLKQGDVITHLDGRPLVRREEMVRAIQSRLPGELVEFTILRADDEAPVDPDGEPSSPTARTVRLRLGSVEQLRQASNDPSSISDGVAHQRRLEMELAERVFGPTSARISVPEDLRAGARAALPIADQELVDHPYIAEVIRQRELLLQGRMRLTPQLLDEWKTRRLELNMALVERDLPPGELNRRREVYIQYLRLTGELLGE